MESELRRSILLGMAAILAGCGGGSGGSDSSGSDSLVKKAKMTVLLYINGSDLESGMEQDAKGNWFKVKNGMFASNNIDEMLKAIYNPDVNIILQTGGTKKEGWDSIKRKQIKNNKIVELSPVSKPNASFADPQTLIDFVQWSKDNYPAEKYVFIFWNHGGGPIGGFGDDQINDYQGVFQLSTKNIKTALESSVNVLGQKFEMIGFDACLMASFEIISAIKNTCNYYAASEEIEPGAGWEYTQVFDYISKNPSTTGKELGIVITDSYLKKNEDSGVSTFSVCDTSLVKNLEASLNELFTALDKKLSQDGLSAWLNIAATRSNALDFSTNIFKGPNSTDLMDIGSFLLSNNIKNIGIPQNLIEKSINALENCIIHNGSDSNLKTSGMSLFFPSLTIANTANNEQYKNNIPKNDGISQFIENYTNFANSNNVPQITISAPVKTGPNTIFSTTSSDYFEQSFAVLYNTNGNIISTQNIERSKNKIQLNDIYSWPTVNNHPISILARYNITPEEDNFLCLASMIFRNQAVEGILIFEKENNRYTCDSFYPINRYGYVYLSERSEKIPMGTKILFPQLELTKNQYGEDILIGNYNNGFIFTTGQDGLIIAEHKKIDISPYQIYLGTSDLIGRIAVSSQPAVL